MDVRQTKRGPGLTSVKWKEWTKEWRGEKGLLRAMKMQSRDQ